MEGIVEELLRAAPHGGQEPYSALSDGRSRIRRVALLRRVAGFLAQEDPRRILSDAAGPYNETTAQIAKQHAGPQVRGDRGHQWRVESLSFCAAAGLSRREAGGLGIDVGASCGQQPPRTGGARIGGGPGRVGKGFARRRTSRATGRLRATSQPGWGRTGGRFGRSTGRSGRYASTSPPVGSARYLRRTNIRPA